MACPGRGRGATGRGGRVAFWKGCGSLPGPHGIPWVRGAVERPAVDAEPEFLRCREALLALLLLLLGGHALAKKGGNRPPTTPAPSSAVHVMEELGPDLHVVLRVLNESRELAVSCRGHRSRPASRTPGAKTWPATT